MNEPRKLHWVAMGPSGELAILTPLYTRWALSTDVGIDIVTDGGEEPLAVVVDTGQEGDLHMLNWERIKDRLEILGEL